MIQDIIFAVDASTITALSPGVESCSKHVC